MPSERQVRAMSWLGQQSISFGGLDRILATRCVRQLGNPFTRTLTWCAFDILGWQTTPILSVYRPRARPVF